MKVGTGFSIFNVFSETEEVEDPFALANEGRNNEDRRRLSKQISAIPKSELLTILLQDWSGRNSNRRLLNCLGAGHYDICIRCGIGRWRLPEDLGFDLIWCFMW